MPNKRNPSSPDLRKLELAVEVTALSIEERQRVKREIKKRIRRRRWWSYLPVTDDDLFTPEDRTHLRRCSIYWSVCMGIVNLTITIAIMQMYALSLETVLLPALIAHTAFTLWGISRHYKLARANRQTAILQTRANTRVVLGHLSEADVYP